MHKSRLKSDQFLRWSRHDKVAFEESYTYKMVFKCNVRLPFIMYDVSEIKSYKACTGSKRQISHTKQLKEISTVNKQFLMAFRITILQWQRRRIEEVKANQYN